MFGEFTIHAGDFGEKQKGQFAGDTFIMPKPGSWVSKEKYRAGDVDTLETATEESVKRIGGTVGWGAAGAVLLGPVGLLAGLLAGGRGKDITFIVQFKDGKKALCTAKSKDYTAMQASTFKGQPSIRDQQQAEHLSREDERRQRDDEEWERLMRGEGFIDQEMRRKRGD